MYYRITILRNEKIATYWEGETLDWEKIESILAQVGEKDQFVVAKHDIENRHTAFWIGGWCEEEMAQEILQDFSENDFWACQCTVCQDNRWEEQRNVREKLGLE